MVQDFLFAKCPYLPTIIYSGFILRAKWNLFSLVASAPKAAVQTLYQSNDLPAEKYRPWSYMVLQRDQRDFFYVLFFCPGLCKGGYYGQKEACSLAGRRVSSTGIPVSNQSQKDHMRREDTGAGINSSSFTDLHAFAVQQLNKLKKEAGSMIHFKILEFWDHLFQYEKLKHIWNPRILVLHAAAIAKQPATFTF